VNITLAEQQQILNAGTYSTDYKMYICFLSTTNSLH